MGELAQQVKTLFMARGVVLPERFDPSMLTAVKPGDPSLQPGNPALLATALFKSASGMKIHIDTAHQVSQEFEALIDAVAAALVQGWNSWTASVKFAGVVINATVGVLPPAGMVGGPSMQEMTLLGAAAPFGKLPSGQRYAAAILGAIATAFDGWAKGYTHPLITFPGGAMCAGSMPPSPCTPSPLAMGTSPGDALLQASALKGVMMAKVGTPGNHADVLFDAFSQAFSMLFLQWKAGQQIMGIMGAGGAASPLGSPVSGAVGNGGMLQGKPVT